MGRHTITMFFALLVMLLAGAGLSRLLGLVNLSNT